MLRASIVSEILNSFVIDLEIYSQELDKSFLILERSSKPWTSLIAIGK